MLGEKYTLDIRPTFVDELYRVAEYVEFDLGNPMAADKLIFDVYEAIEKTLDHPLVTSPRYLPPDVQQPYYVIYLRNFSIYYVVRDHVMEVRWFRYSRSIRPLEQ